MFYGLLTLSRRTHFVADNEIVGTLRDIKTYSGDIKINSAIVLVNTVKYK